MNSAELLPSEEEALRAWDWHADLTRAKRSIAWLARETNRNQQTLYQIKAGVTRPSLAWLRDAARVLRKEGAG